MTKQELRAIYREKRNQIPENTRKTMDASLVEQILKKIEGLQHIAIFLPIEKFHEIDLRPLLASKQFKWYAPISNFEDRSMQFVQVSQDSEIITNEFGIPEPKLKGEIAPDLLDGIVVPMLIADINGYRVGYGKGFYDAFLKRCRANCLKIGVSYFPPIEIISDVEQHDEKIDICLVPN
jgi:5-formyltetrahydrofolate cyclo-ligase